MKVKDKYDETLKYLDCWVTVPEWAQTVCERYPELLAAANEQAAGQKVKTTGISQIERRLYSNVSVGANKVQIDNLTSPRKVKYMTEDEQEAIEEEEFVKNEIEPSQRNKIVREAEGAFSGTEKYRTDEFWAISKLLKSYFGVAFEVDHAHALLNPESPGPHYPDNFQLLTKIHNVKKHNKNWERFTIDEQIIYVNSVVQTQKIIADRCGLDIDMDILESLMNRLRNVY